MDKNSYALGMNMGMSMLQSGIREVKIDDFAAGLSAMLEGKTPAVSMEEAMQILEKYFAALDEERQAEQAEIGKAFKEEGEKFLAGNAKKEGVKVTASGLQYKVIKEGTGRKPKATDRIRCHYEGTFTDGRVFDSSYKRGEPIDFGLNQVIKGWTEGLQLMAEGAKYELYIPYQLAYGETGSQGAIPPCCALKFTVELIKVL